jgi:anti-sigma regulatory factor (Ser/Thr protein kinase)
MTNEASFDSKPASVARARRFTEEALGGVSDLVALDVVLMVSELATNAVVHAGTTFSLRIERSEEFVRVEVVDAGDGQVRLQSPSNSDVHGRGLQLVQTLSDQWGTRQLGQAKSVWFVRNLVPGGADRLQGNFARNEPRVVHELSGAKQASGHGTAQLRALSIAV